LLSRTSGGLGGSALGRASGVGARRSGARGTATPGPAGPARTAILGCRSGRGQLATSTDDVALVDPHLHTDAAEGGLRFVESVVDVGAQRVQRHASLAVELTAAHLCAAEA